MEMAILVLLLVFFGLLLLNVPISFCIGLATLATMLLSVDFMPAVTTMAQRMAGGGSVKYNSGVVHLLDHLHQLELVDQPVSGRLLDGENGQLGLVGITDRPFQGFV